ncbi:MAG: DNA mismatch repair endonuclease MutL [Kiritimatiellia bacterium]
MEKKSGAKIRMLSQDVANKIAAGEVVERPASVVKELLENALDAGSTRIDIVVTAGGRKLISIADNGSGMGRDDALMAPERQATSKIRTVQDIDRIQTMGFRGEALASIASVSHFTLRTRRPEDDAGTEIVIHGGIHTEVCDCGMPPGTTLEVRDLFYNLPARRAFLRSFQTEEAHIRNQVIVHAISRPDVAFSLTCDGASVYGLRPATSLQERLCDLFGSSQMEGFVAVDRVFGAIHVHGFIGLASNTRADAQGQYVFVNQRPATAPAVQAAIREAYPRMEPGRRPQVFLFLDVPPESVDVNVHPTKREVRFRAVGAVRDAVLATISSALSPHRAAAVFSPGSTPEPVSAPAPVSQPEQPQQQAVAPTLPKPLTLSPPPRQEQFAFHPISDTTFRAQRVTPPVPADPTADALLPALPPIASASTSATAPSAPPPIVQPSPSVSVHAPVASPPPPTPSVPTAPAAVPEPSASAPWTNFRILGTLRSGYLMLETDGGYTIVDPCAAHERVIYERLMSLAAQTDTLSQRLLIPQTVAMSPVDARRIRTLLPVLVSMGFDVEDFGGDTFVVHAMPDIVAGASAKSILEETALALEEAGPRRGRQHWQEELVAAAASRGAVRTGKALNLEEQKVLLRELAGCKLPYASPLGYPTMIFTSTRELDRKFRKGGSN